MRKTCGQAVEMLFSSLWVEHNLCTTWLARFWSPGAKTGIFAQSTHRQTTVFPQALFANFTLFVVSLSPSSTRPITTTTTYIN